MDFQDFRIVRLNAELFPVTSFEQAAYDRHGLAPSRVEVQTDDELLQTVERADAVLVVSQALPTAIVSRMSQCRVICRLGAGTDKIDVDGATAQGIVVANVPDFCVEEQADHAFAMLLAIARKLNAMQGLFLQGQYREGREQSRPLRRISSCTLGLVGFGRSARAMARRAHGFGMTRILATRRNHDKVDPAIGELGVELVELDALLAASDFVSLHLPLNADTHHILDAQRLTRMKPGSVLINTSRGALVDEEALADVLEAGHLAGAGLDTFAIVDLHDPNTGPPQHRLFEQENVVVTPHVAAFSQESSRDVAVGTVENLVRVLSGHWPQTEHIVNPDVQPRLPLAKLT